MEKRKSSSDSEGLRTKFKQFWGSVMAEFPNSKETQDWNERIRQIRNEQSERKAWVAARAAEVMDILKVKAPSDSSTGLSVLAEERANIEYLCKSRNVLPVGGATDEELAAIGLPAHTRPNNPPFGGYLRPMIFPDGWDMVPVTKEPELTNGDRATIFDANGIAVVEVGYRESTWGATEPRGYVSILDNIGE
jgi:hypothetical protein